jgi:Domain of unknown function (DUF4258)
MLESDFREDGLLPLRRGERSSGLRPWVWVFFTHHAKNKLREYEVSLSDIEAVVRNPTGKDFDPSGNPRYRGFIAGERFLVVVALDDSNVIITLFPRERR